MGSLNIESAWEVVSLSDFEFRMILSSGLSLMYRYDFLLMFFPDWSFGNCSSFCMSLDFKRRKREQTPRWAVAKHSQRI